MGILSRFKERVNKYNAEADERAEKRIKNADTEALRDRERARIQRERMQTKKEVAEAKTALLKAEGARKRAAKEVKQIGNGFFSNITKALKPRKVAKRRKSVATAKPKKRAKRTTRVTKKTTKRVTRVTTVRQPKRVEFY